MGEASETEAAGLSISARALVVDDLVSVAHTVALCLERQGLACDLAHSPREAMRMASRARYDLVYADVHMPGGSGLELARDLKRLDPSIQVIIMTGSTTLETAVEALRLDADDYLVKPFDVPTLIHSARRAIEHRRLLLENLDYRRTLEERVREQARRIERTYLSGIRSLVTALEAKDPHTHGHSERVAAYAAALADRVGGVDPETVRLGAQLHDIGKIGTTTAILLKPGPLTADELAQVRRHPEVGVQILRPMLQDRTVLDIVMHHHERWDGRGYPHQLAGEGIPRAARIVAVADAFDAMTTVRPYRAGRTHEQAVAEIEAESGRQFDPALAGVAREALMALAELAS